MTDSLFLNGNDANMSKDEYLIEIERAEALNDEEIRSLMSQLFVTGPARTMDDLSDEEILIRKYRLEKSIRLLRVHLHTNERKISKRRESRAKDIDIADRKYKPAPIPLVKRASSDADRRVGNLASQIAELTGCTVEEAREKLKK